MAQFATEDEVLARTSALPARRSAAPDPNAASDAEIAALKQRGGAGGVYGRGGKLMGFRDMGERGGSVMLRPPAAPAEKPFQYTEEMMNADNPPYERTSAVPPAAPGAVNNGVAPTATTSAQPQLAFKDYQSTNPESMYDDDIRFAHTLSRMAGMAGLGDKAMQTRDLYYKLNGARMQEITNNAQRAFMSGDPTKLIDVFNHAVPNGNKILRYTRTPDNNYAFDMEDGSVQHKSAQELMDSLTAFRDPKVLGTMMAQRAKSLAETQGKLLEEHYKQQGRVSLANLKFENDVNLLIGKEQMDYASKAALDAAKRANPESKVAFDGMGGVFIQTREGIFKFGDVQLKGGGKQKGWIKQDVPGGEAPGAAPAASMGYTPDPVRMGNLAQRLQVPPQYTP